MSYPGTRESAKADAKAADTQLDGLEPGSTSPIQHGQSPDGAFHMKIKGETEFTNKRTRGENHTHALKKGAL